MSRRCFTLVELLTVVAVIAILAGITIPVVVGMSSKGKEVTARADMNAIKLALTQFKSDYSVWPVTPSASDTLLRAGFSAKDKDEDIDKLMQELTLIEAKPGTDNVPGAYTPTLNKKKRKYLDAPAKPVPALIEVNSVPSGFFKLDPWGRRYNIAIDTNYDKKLELTAAFLGTGSTAETIVGDVAVYSYGPAEDDGDLEAFLYSWKTLADK